MRAVNILKRKKRNTFVSGSFHIDFFKFKSYHLPRDPFDANFIHVVTILIMNHRIGIESNIKKSTFEKISSKSETNTWNLQEPFMTTSTQENFFAISFSALINGHTIVERRTTIYNVSLWLSLDKKVHLLLHNILNKILF